MIVCKTCFNTIKLNTPDPKSLITHENPISLEWKHGRGYNHINIQGDLLCNRCSNGTLKAIDDAIAEIIIEYWKFGLDTDYSCQGHFEDVKMIKENGPYVLFNLVGQEQYVFLEKNLKTFIRTNNISNINYYNCGINRMAVRLNIESVGTPLSVIKTCIEFHLFLINFLEYLQKESYNEIKSNS